MRRCALLIRIIFPLCIFGSGCSKSPINAQPMTLQLISSDFAAGGNIPKTMTCDGAELSPALSWQTLPPQTVSVVIIGKDLDSSFSQFVHWSLYNLSPETRSIPAGLSKVEELQDGSRQGKNGMGNFGYKGPCPPGHSPHRYVFRLYALNTKLASPPDGKERKLEDEMAGHILAAGEIIGIYRH